jgi:glucose-6-phosphate dehydrogenase assembly protein OpcA
VSNACVATVIVVGKAARVAEAGDALDNLGEVGAVRSVLIFEGNRTTPKTTASENRVRIEGLSARYLDNAVAAVRLSSLPAVVWWRGGSVDALEGLADLADRLVLDTDPADQVWAEAPRLFDRTAVTDLRWTSLTRWRAALAHIFDLPQVRREAGALRLVEIDAADRPSARLFAGWLRSCLQWKNDVTVDIRDAETDAPSPLVRVRLSGGDLAVTLQVREHQSCLEAEVNAVSATRVVPLGDGTLASLFAEELGVRTRDTAFERALVAAMELPV